MVPDVQIVQSTDPRVVTLEDDGYRLVGESWGARLRLREPLDLELLRRAVTAATDAGFIIRELDAGFAEALFELELANNADYPFTPATHQASPVRGTIAAFWRDGKRVFGALDHGALVAAVVGQVVDRVGDNDFASVLAEYRGRKVGAAVAAASIIAFASDGVREFTAGGAAANSASLALVRSIGFEIEEQWRSYERD